MYSWSPKETTLVPCVMHTQSNTVSTFLLGLIREYNGWLFIVVDELSSTSEIGIRIIHDQRIGPFKWPAEDEINFVASIRMKTFYYY